MEQDAREEERERRKEQQIDTLICIFGEYKYKYFIFSCSMNDRGLFYLHFGCQLYFLISLLKVELALSCMCGV